MRKLFLVAMAVAGLTAGGSRLYSAGDSGRGSVGDGDLHGKGRGRRHTRDSRLSLRSPDTHG